MEIKMEIEMPKLKSMSIYSLFLYRKLKFSPEIE